MLRVASDENFDGYVLRGIRQRIQALDLVRAVDAGLRGISDPMLLEWCAVENRVLLTHDRKTIPPYAYARIQAGLPMRGVFVVDLRAPLGAVVDELVALIEEVDATDCTNRVLFINPAPK